MVHIVARVAFALVSLNLVPLVPTCFAAFKTPKHLLLRNSDATCEYFPVLLYPRHVRVNGLQSYHILNE